MEIERLNKIIKKMEERKLKYPSDMTLFDEKTCVRDVKEAVCRAVISAIMAKCAYDLYGVENTITITNKAKDELNAFGVIDKLFEEEREVLSATYYSRLCDTIGWRYESARALLWAVGLVDSIDDAANPENIEASINETYAFILKYGSIENLLSACRMRDTLELADEFQTYWYYHWNIVDGMIRGQWLETISYDVVLERRRALQWLVYSDEDNHHGWHKIDLDT